MPRTPSLNSLSDKEKRPGNNVKPVLVEDDHPSYELVYDMLNGIKNAVVESYAQRASREEDLDLNYSIPLIALLPKDFESQHKFTYTT